MQNLGFQHTFQSPTSLNHALVFSLSLVQFGLVWFGLVWFGLVQFSLVQGWFGLGLVGLSLVQFSLVWFGVSWLSLVWFDLVWSWFGLGLVGLSLVGVWFGLVQFSLVQFGLCFYLAWNYLKSFWWLVGGGLKLSLVLALVQLDQDYSFRFGLGPS